MLRDEAYTGVKLDAQLEDAGSEFINDKSKNRITPARAELSKYFSWYKGDFTKDGSLVNYINKYSQAKVTPGTKVGYIEYNWNLNEQR